MTIFNLPDKARPVPSTNALNRWLSDAEKGINISTKRLGWWSPQPLSSRLYSARWAMINAQCS